MAKRKLKGAYSSLKFSKNRSFPDPLAPFETKETDDYGLQMGKLIEHEWFYIKSGNTYNEYYDKRIRFDEERRYARGEHDTGLVKKLISDGTDGESYTNYDWRPIQVYPKFVKLVVNQMLERLYEIDAQAIDGISQGLRDDYRKILEKNMVSKPMLEDAKSMLGIDLMPAGMGEIPESYEELDLQMKLTYKPAIEIAIEQALKYTLELNEYDEIQKRLLKDLTEIGVAAMHHKTDPVKGIVVEYVDPADMVWSYPEVSNFDNVYYYGHVKRMTLSELQRISGRKLSKDEIEDFKNVSNEWQGYNRISNQFWYRGEDLPSHMVDVLFFTYKTTKVNKFKKKYKRNGSYVITEKPSDYIKPQSQLDKEMGQGYKDYDVLEDVDDIWFEGALVLGSNMLFNYREAEEVLRPEGFINNKVSSNYVIYAPEIYQGRIQSLTSRVKQYVDQLQQIAIKIQQFIAKAKPNGIWIDIDGLQDLDLGEGASFTPLDLIKYYDDTGNLLGTTKLSDGGYNAGAMPIKELNNGDIAGLDKLMNAYNFHLNLFREAIGIGQGSDGTLPHPDTSVGALQNQEVKSNVATRYILDSQLKMTQYLANGIALRLKSLFDYEDMKNAYINSIGQNNMDVIESINSLHLHDFGISIKLKPDAQDRAMLEANIQAEIAAGGLSTTDGIDIRRIGNISLANAMIKVRKEKNEKIAQQRELQKIEAQGQANQQATQAAAQAKQQEIQMEFGGKKDLLLTERENERLKMEQELKAKKELMALAFIYDTDKEKAMRIAEKEKQKESEDRKDKRTELQATQQSKMIEQRKKEGSAKPIDFTGTTLTGELGMDDFRV